MKKYYLLATALAAMVSCTSDDYVGDNNLQEANGQAAISFNMNTPAVTRAQTGGAAATTLHNNFVLFGYKTVSETSSTVFDNYQVNYVASTEGSTESNSAGWEYVSYKNLPYGTTTTSGGALNNNGVASNASGSSTNVEQSIKYWDFAATSYDFFAYSLGAGTGGETPTYAKASKMENSTYSLTGSQAQLGACYISKKNTMAPPSAAPTTAVTLEFMSFLSKIELRFYETIPGYSIKNLKFYNVTSGGTSSATPYLIGTVPTEGTYTVTFDSNGDPVLALSGATNSTYAEFTAPTTFAAAEYREAAISGEDKGYIARTASTATATNQISVLPNSTGATMTIRVDYTLVSRDGTGETINVTGATATIPAAYTKWKPNYAYTYIFKISDNTNGNVGSITGLYPITLDAQVAETTVAEQTTITTVHTPSITTYQKGAVSNEYSAGNIYVLVEDGSATLTATGETPNVKLYTATIESGAAQGVITIGETETVAITEEMVKNALTQTADGSGNYVLSDARGKKLTVIPAAADALTVVTTIPADDAPNSKAIEANCAKFTAVTNTVYVFEYVDNTPEKHYKVIKVGTPTPISGS